MQNMKQIILLTRTSTFLGLLMLASLLLCGSGSAAEEACLEDIQVEGTRDWHWNGGGELWINSTNPGGDMYRFTLELVFKNNESRDQDYTITIPAKSCEHSMKDWEITFLREGSIIPTSGFALDALQKAQLSMELEIPTSSARESNNFTIEICNKGEPNLRETLRVHLNCRKEEYGVMLEYGGPDSEQWNQSFDPVNQPDEWLEYRFRLSNTGTDQDSFLLKIETATQQGKYGNWSILFDTRFGPQSQIRVPSEHLNSNGEQFLEPGERRVVKVLVRPVADVKASGNEPDILQDMELSAQSGMDSQQEAFVSFGLVVIRPDLRIDVGDLHLQWNIPLDIGDLARLQLTIHNDGSASTTAFSLWVYQLQEDSLEGIGGVVGLDGLLLHHRVTTSIDPHSSLTLDLGLNIAWGSHEIYVQLDKAVVSGPDSTRSGLWGDILEKNEANNHAMAGRDPYTGRPYRESLNMWPWIELKEVSLSHRPVPGKEVIVTVTILNSQRWGTTVSYGVHPEDSPMFLRCWASGEYLQIRKEGENRSCWEALESLEAGEEMEFEFLWTVDSPAGSTVKIKPFLDYTGGGYGCFHSTSVTVEEEGKEEHEDTPGFGAPVLVLTAVMAALCFSKKPN